MKGYINGIDYYNLPAMKYYTFPKTWSDDKKKETVYNRFMSGEWLMAQKRDGAWFKLLKDEDGNITLTGRSRGVGGEYLDKWDHLPQLVDWANKLPIGTCLIGEVYVPAHEGSKNTTSIMGCLTAKAIKRQEDPDWRAHYYVFEVLAFDGEHYYTKPASERFAKIAALDSTYHCPDVEYAEYKTGLDGWNLLQKLLADGYEGGVMTHCDAVYQPDKRPNTTLKVKKEISQTVDCVVMGINAPTREYRGDHPEDWEYWEEEKTERQLPEGRHWSDKLGGAKIEPVTKAWYKRWAGSFKIGLYRNGQLTYLGDISGLTDEEKANWEDYIGKVCEVGGMEIFADGDHRAIRHPKLISWRTDKPVEDCTWDQIA